MNARRKFVLMVALTTWVITAHTQESVEENTQEFIDAISVDRIYEDTCRELAAKYGSDAVPTLKARIRDENLSVLRRGITCFVAGFFSDCSLPPLISKFVEDNAVGDMEKEQAWAVRSAILGLGFSDCENVRAKLRNLARKSFWDGRPSVSIPHLRKSGEDASEQIRSSVFLAICARGDEIASYDLDLVEANAETPQEALEISVRWRPTLEDIRQRKAAKAEAKRRAANPEEE